MNIKMLKAAFTGLILSVSGLASAGFITTIELGTATTDLNFNFDTVVMEWSSSSITGTIDVTDITELTMRLYAGESEVFHDEIIENSIVLEHVGYPRILYDIDFGFDFNTMTLIGFDNYAPYSKLDEQDSYVTMNIYFYDGVDFNATPASDFDDDFYTEEWSQSTITTVPEPSILTIFAIGIFGIASRRLKKQY